MLLLAFVAIAYPFINQSSGTNPIFAALPGGILVALSAQLFAQGKNFSDQAERSSLFYLDSCVKAFEEARQLLADGNNDRATWIAAGRALAHAKQLASAVTEDSHLRVLELHKLKYRGVFHDLLHEKTAAFFYGAEDPAIPTDEAARRSTAGEDRNERMLASTLKYLSDKSLRTVWEAAQWPKDYADPLDAAFSDEERAHLLVLFPGLHEYLEHSARWHSAAGRLFPRERENGAS